MDYIKTPSFYTNEEYFNKYLGSTSYYNSLQKVVKKVIGIVKPKNILELGSALGTTLKELAETFSETNFVGFDIRKDMVDNANSKVNGLSNVKYFTGDMRKVVKSDLSDFDFVFMLYSFHHIEDPNVNKLEFLNDCYGNMKKGSYLMITETFLPEDGREVSELFELRGVEGYASTFWECLDSLNRVDIGMNSLNAEVSKNEEIKAGKLVERRDTEYLVEAKWLAEAGIACGFELVLNEPVNAIGERVVLFRR